jgi:uncharacterized tellurite resistance protein B-like protein
MLDALRKLIADSLPAVPAMDPPTSPYDIRVAACALLLEVAYVDGTMTADERAEIARTLVADFGVDQRGAEEIMAMAETVLRDAPSERSITAQLVSEYDEDQRMLLRDMIRNIAGADRRLHDHEALLLARLDRLLALPPQSA